MSSLFLVRDIYCPFTSAVPLIERFAHNVPLRVGPIALIEATVHADVALTNDYTDHTRIHDALVLQWRAHARFPLPRFRGLITVRPHGPSTRLRVDAEYVPPLGPLGRLFDAVIGRAIARASLARFLAAIARSIDRDYGKERMLSGNW